MKSATRRARAGASTPSRPSRPLRRHVVRLHEEAGEQRAHHLLGVGHHGDDARVAVHAGPEERLDGAVGRGHHGREADHAAPAARTSSAEVGAAAPSRRTLSAITSSIIRPIRRRTSSCVSRAGSMPGILLAHLAQQAADHRHLREVGEREQLGAQPVVEVVRVIGDVVGDRRDLRLGARRGSRARGRASRCSRR